MPADDDRREHNILLTAPASADREFDHCVDLMTPRAPPHLNVWSLGITLPADERLRIWEDRRDSYPADFKIVSGQTLPQDACTERAEELGFDPTPRFVTLDSPKNLTRIGILLTEAFQEWEDSPNETVVCFHSLTSLLQYVSVETAYQFLHPFTSKVRQFGATAHYHINPRVHDAKDIEKLSMLFDSVREPTSEAAESEYWPEEPL